MGEKARCSIVVLGCAKNQIDAEEMASRLERAGYEIAGDPAAAQLIIVHTCGFIEKARRESIRALLGAVSLKYGAGPDKPEGTMTAGPVPGSPRVLVTGCLARRYPGGLLEEIPELDGLAGTQAPRDIVELAGRVLAGERVVEVGEPGRGVPGSCAESEDVAPGLRLRPGLASWAYLRVAEGCRRRCTYCAIPLMRGPLVSRPVESIVREAEFLASHGVREIDLIAQDLGDYGMDRCGKRLLSELLLRLSDVSGIAWIRPLYVHPDGVTRELARAMARTRCVPYVDMPIEHGSARILKLMGRPGPDRIRRAVDTLREHIPGLFLRTSVIVGFPGETRGDFESTMELLAGCGFHRVAVFAYSKEEGTQAALLPGRVSPRKKRMRLEEMRHLSVALSRESSLGLLSRELDVLLERPGLQPGWWVGRAPHQAPEVDGKVFVRPAPGTSPAPGDILRATVTSAGILNLWARE